MPLGIQLSQLPRQARTATWFTASTLTPSTFATACAVFTPPAAQPSTGASPLAQAAANPSQPGYPQPPQFAPGRTFRIISALASGGTANTFLKKPSRTPIANARSKETMTAIKTVFIETPDNLCADYLINPLKPKKDSESRPAVINRIGLPLRNAGIAELFMRSRTPDMITSARRNPHAVPAEYTSDC